MKKLMIILTIPAFILLQNCAPVFSEMQGARMVGKEKFEVTPYFTSTGVKGYEEAEMSPVQSHVGVHLAKGISDNVDLRMRLEYIWDNEWGGSISVIGLGTKFNLVRNRVALFTPVLFTGSLAEFQPALLFTLPVVKDKLDFNPSVKYITLFCGEEGCNSVAVNMGFSLMASESTVLRAEYGLLFYPGEEGRVSQFSIGFSYMFSKRKK